MVNVVWPTDWAPKPNISWLSYNTFDECQRKWLNQYLTALYPKPEYWDYANHSRLMPVEALAGRVVDDTIDIGLKLFVENGAWPSSLYPYAKTVLGGYIKFSKRWTRAVEDKTTRPNNPEFQAIDAIFFEQKISNEMQEKIVETVQRCLDNFEASDIPTFIENYSTEDWILKPNLSGFKQPWFMLSDMPVYANFDFIVRSENETIIFDWKCGKVENDKGKALEQLHWYACYVMEEWGVPASAIRLAPIWLAEKVSLEFQSVDTRRIELIKSIWRQRFELLRERLKTGGEDLDIFLKMFPTTPYPNVCRQCAFRSCPSFNSPDTQSNGEWDDEY